MPRFTYVSKNLKGSKITAVAEAESRANLLNFLKDQGLTVIEIKEQSAAESPLQFSLRKISFARFSFGSINTTELALFWRQFSTMISAGLPIIDALQAIAEEVENAKFKRILSDIVARMWEGLSLSESLKKYPAVFSVMVTALVGAAEESGSLPQVAKQIADFLENRDRLIHKVRAALTYPIFLFGFFILAMGIATFWIIPKFRGIYSSFQAQLPPLTETVFAINAFILAHVPFMLFCFVAFIVGFVLWIRTTPGRFMLHQMILMIPVLGKLLQKAALSRFFRSLSILLSGGVPINRALEMSQETAGNRIIAKAIQAAREDIVKGGKVAASFRKHRIFPRMSVRMMSVGEETGSMDELLEKMADFYETQVDTALSMINTLIEPIMIILIGAFVLVFVLAIYLPIFKLAATMKG